ncbi:MAG: DUF2871 family protein [Candidatus Enteromonas sp.]
MEQNFKRIFKFYLIAAFAFLIAGLVAGVFYREFSKAFDMAHVYTPLGLVHPHLLALGMGGMLLIGFMNAKLGVEGKLMKGFVIAYIVGVAASFTMLLIRGTSNVMNAKTPDTFILPEGMFAGISGIFHAALGVGLVGIFILWLLAFKKDKANA